MEPVEQSLGSAKAASEKSGESGGNSNHAPSLYQKQMFTPNTGAHRKNSKRPSVLQIAGNGKVENGGRKTGSQTPGILECNIT